MWVWIGSKLIIGLVVTAAGTLAGCYANVLWLNTVALVLTAVIIVLIKMGYNL